MLEYFERIYLNAITNNPQAQADCFGFSMNFVLNAFACRPVCSFAKHITIGTRGLGFDLRAGLIGRGVVNGSSPLLRIVGALLPRRKATKMVPASSYAMKTPV